MTVCTCNPRTRGRGCGDSGMTEVAGQPTWQTVSSEFRKRETVSWGKGGCSGQRDSGRHLKSYSGLHTGTHGCKHLYTQEHAPHTTNMCSHTCTCVHTHTKTKSFNILEAFPSFYISLIFCFL